MYGYKYIRERNHSVNNIPTINLGVHGFKSLDGDTLSQPECFVIPINLWVLVIQSYTTTYCF